MKFVYDVDVEGFKKAVDKDVNLLCFGSGRYAEACYHVLDYYDILPFVKGFIDNDCTKWGMKFKVGSYSYPIMSFDSFVRTYNMHNTILLITCADVTGVVNQIQESRLNDNIIVYIWQLILSQSYGKTHSSTALIKHQNMLIPKKIHYCWFGDKQIPDEHKRYIDGWHRLCPDYEIIQWNESNYDVSKNRYMLQAYENKKWGFVPDYARLDIIYQHGGIYLDTDVELLKNLDSLLYQEAFAGIHIRRYISLGLAFGAKREHNFIKELRDYYDEIDFVDEKGQINMTACDLHQYNVLKKYKFRLDNSFQQIKGLSIYPTDYFDGMDSYTKQLHINENTFSVHHNSVSWFTAQMRTEMNNRLQFFREILG